MKQSNLYFKTTKEVTNQAVANSHILALKSGLIHQTAAGIYTYSPLMVKILKNVEQIIREELELIGANEVIMPLLQPSQLWEESNRWQNYGEELVRLKDRKNNSFALAPTHEEVVTDYIKNNLNSYKNYPVNLFQIGTKMRDEIRPRFGLLRGREFVMMDGYSFHTDDEDLNHVYDLYYQAYINIFTRLGLNFKVVTADNGSMGGNKSHEFMAIAEIGEDTIYYEEKAEMAYNEEVAPVYINIENQAASEDLKKVETKDVKTIEEVSEFLNTSKDKIVKTIAYEIDDEIGLVLIRGDRQINEVKLNNIFSNAQIRLASTNTLNENGLCYGFVGPFNLNNIKTVIVDQELHNESSLIIGANEENFHFTGFNIKRDLSEYQTADIRNVTTGELMFESGDFVQSARGIEIGHIFALGDTYTKAMGVEFLTKEQKKQVPTMGCYGIGVSRIISAIIEQNNDENGIVLPTSVTPYDIHLIPLDYNKKESQKEFTDKLYDQLVNKGYKVLVDDRDERPGVKFNDADLIGFPYQVIVGRDYEENVVEFKERKTKEAKKININEIFDHIN